MLDFLSGALVLILRLVGFVLEIAQLVCEARQVTKFVELPPEPKVPPPAAQRALAEAEERRR